MVEVSNLKCCFNETITKPSTGSTCYIRDGTKNKHDEKVKLSKEIEKAYNCF